TSPTTSTNAGDANRPQAWVVGLGEGVGGRVHHLAAVHVTGVEAALHGGQVRPKVLRADLVQPVTKLSDLATDQVRAQPIHQALLTPWLFFNCTSTRYTVASRSRKSSSSSVSEL